MVIRDGIGSSLEPNKESISDHSATRDFQMRFPWGERGGPQHDLRSVRIGAKPAPDDRLSARQANTLSSLLDGRDITPQDLKSQQKPPKVDEVSSNY
jgi:hypothetical protein